jgi:ATP-binding cassette subfamily B protein
MKSLRRMMHFLKPYQRQSILAIVLFVGVVAADLSIPRLTQRIIDDGIAIGDMSVILTTSLIMIGAAILSALLSIGNTVLAVRVGQGVGADLRSAIVRKVQTFSFGNLDRIQTGQLLVRATSDVNQVQMIVLISLRMFIRAPLWMVGSVIMLLLTSPQLALLMLILLPVLLVLVWLFAARARPLFLAIQKKLDKLNQVLQENLAGVRVVKAFVRVEYENARFDQANTDLMTQNIKVMQLLAVLIPTVMLVLNLGIVGAVWFGGNLVVAGDLTMGEMVAFTNYLLTAMFPLLILGMMIGPVSAADASAERMWEILDSVAEVQDHPGARALAGVKGRVAFEGVTFSYNSGSGEAVLENVNLVAEPGQTVAILGATGSGKSSLVHLIPRFYDVTAGRVTLDGVDVRDIPLDALRAQVGLALQEAVLFSGPIRDNIRYGRPGANDEEVIAAAQAAQAHGAFSSWTTAPAPWTWRRRQKSRPRWKS